MIGGISLGRQKLLFASVRGAKYNSENEPGFLVSVSAPAVKPDAFTPQIPLKGRRGRTQDSVRLRTLVLIRWLAIVGQMSALFLLFFVFGYELPLIQAMLVVAMSVGLNAVLSIRYSRAHRLTDRVAALYLVYDTLQLALLLYFTGGLANPFSLLLLAPVAVAATILSLGSAVMVGFLTIICVTILALPNFHFPLPWEEEGLELPGLYVYGQWTAMAVGVGFLGAYLWWLAADARRMSDALVATQISLAREQRLSALGGLAAAAAHELSTPLGTITMAAKEMERAAKSGSEMAIDAGLISSEAARCRDILGRIARGPEQQSRRSFIRKDLESMLRDATVHQRRKGVQVLIEVKGSENPYVVNRPEIAHGLTNIVENAVKFARSTVMVEAEVRTREICVRVLDDGPGFMHDVLGALGEPYISSHSRDAGLGLGVFIAKTLLERTGGEMTALNRIEGGAHVEIVWPRAALEARQEEAI